MQADDGNDASPPSSPTAASGSLRCVACLVLISRDWPRRLWLFRLDLPTTEDATRSWGKRNEPAHRWWASKMLFLGMISNWPHRVKRTMNDMWEDEGFFHAFFRGFCLGGMSVTLGPCYYHVRWATKTGAWLDVKRVCARLFSRLSVALFCCEFFFLSCRCCCVCVYVYWTMHTRSVRRCFGGRPCCVSFALPFRLRNGCACESLQLGWPRSRILFLCACDVLIFYCVCLRISAMTRWRKKNRVECSRTLTLPCLRTQAI